MGDIFCTDAASHVTRRIQGGVSSVFAGAVGSSGSVDAVGDLFCKVAFRLLGVLRPSELICSLPIGARDGLSSVPATTTLSRSVAHALTLKHTLAMVGWVVGVGCVLFD